MKYLSLAQKKHPQKTASGKADIVKSYSLSSSMNINLFNPEMNILVSTCIFNEKR